MIKKIIILLLLFLFLPVIGQSQELKSVTVGWDYPLQTHHSACIPSNDYCVTGFSVYAGSSSGNYTANMDVECSVTRGDGEVITAISCSPLCLGPGTASDLTSDPTATECRTSITNLQEGQTYYLAATAYFKNSVGEKIA